MPLSHPLSSLMLLHLIRIRAKLLYLFCEVSHHLREPRTFGGRDPLQPEPLGLDTEVFEHESYCVGPLFRLQIAFLIVTVPWMTPTDQDAIGSLRQGIDHQIRMDHARTHHPDDPQARRILDSRHPCQISPGIGAPVAAETDDQRVKHFIHHPTPKAAFTWAEICSSLNPFTNIPCFGQVAIQHPQPLHTASFTSTVFLTASCLMYSRSVIPL